MCKYRFNQAVCVILGKGYFTFEKDVSELQKEIEIEFF